MVTSSSATQCAISLCSQLRFPKQHLHPFNCSGQKCECPPGSSLKPISAPCQLCFPPSQPSQTPGATYHCHPAPRLLQQPLSDFLAAPFVPNSLFVIQQLSQCDPLKMQVHSCDRYAQIPPMGPQSLGAQAKSLQIPTGASRQPWVFPLQASPVTFPLDQAPPDIPATLLLLDHAGALPPWACGHIVPSPWKALPSGDRMANSLLWPTVTPVPDCPEHIIQHPHFTPFSFCSLFFTAHQFPSAQCTECPGLFIVTCLSSQNLGTAVAKVLKTGPGSRKPSKDLLNT